MKAKTLKTSVKVTDKKYIDRMEDLRSRETGLRMLAEQVALLLGELNKQSTALFDEIVEKYGLDPGYIYAYEHKTKQFRERYRRTISHRPAKV